MSSRLMELWYCFRGRAAPSARERRAWRSDGLWVGGVAGREKRLRKKKKKRSDDREERKSECLLSLSLPFCSSLSPLLLLLSPRPA